MDGAQSAGRDEAAGAGSSSAGQLTDGDLALVKDGGTREGFSCWDLRAGRQSSPDKCTEGARQVREQLQVAEWVLRYDLQRSLKAKLEE